MQNALNPDDDPPLYPDGVKCPLRGGGFFSWRFPHIRHQSIVGKSRSCSNVLLQPFALHNTMRSKKATKATKAKEHEVEEIEASPKQANIPSSLRHFP